MKLFLIITDHGIAHVDTSKNISVTGDVPFDAAEHTVGKIKELCETFYKDELRQIEQSLDKTSVGLVYQGDR